MATIVWRDVSWAHADKRIFVSGEGGDLCHAGLYWRHAMSGDSRVLIGGVGGVMTLPHARKRGCASLAMREAEKVMREKGCDFGLLFCEPHIIALYRGLGWSVFAGEVRCEQADRTVSFDIMHAMVLPLRFEPRPETIDLCGLPW